MLRPPPLALAALEPVRAAWAAAAYLTQTDALGIEGAGQPVIVYPGLGTSAAATLVLRSFLQRCGFAVYDWAQGINTGPPADFDAWLQTLAHTLTHVHARHRRRVSLLGWSLGGIYARELAKCRPDLVAQVVTLGTPFTGHPKATNAWPLYRLLNGRSPCADAALLRRLRRCPPVRTHSVYSRSDGIVSWRCAKAPPGARTRNVELNHIGHLGLVVHPHALRTVGRLLQPRRRRV